MSFSIQAEDNRTSMIYALEPGQEIDTFSLGMLTENKIAGLAETAYTQMDTQKYVVYNITAKMPASQLFVGPTSKQRIVRLFLGITEALLASEEYMIPIGSILLDMDMIYCDVASEKAALLCLPLIGMKQAQDPCTFFKSILFNTQFDQSENCDYVTTLLNYLNTHPMIPYADFRKLLLGMNQTPQKAPPSISSASSNNAFNVSHGQRITMQQPVIQQPFVQQPVVQQPVVQQPVIQPPVAQQPIVQQFKQPVAPQDSAQQPLRTNEEEKRMSMIYLLRHYNAENKAIYDSQKQSKGKQTKGNPNKGKKDKGNKDKPVSKAKGKGGKGGKTADLGFQVPGPFQREEYTPASNPVAVAARDHVQPIQQPQTAPPSFQQPQVIAPQFQQPQVATPQFQQPAAPQQAFSGGAQSYPSGGGADFGDTDYFTNGDTDGGTVILDSRSPAQRMGPYLLRIKNNERIPLNKPVFRIGREDKRHGAQTVLNDYYVSDNPYVGNNHAVILTRNGEYFLIDNSSKNHTYLNGEMLAGGMEAKLAHGSRIALANEEFEFNLY